MNRWDYVVKKRIFVLVSVLLVTLGIWAMFVHAQDNDLPETPLRIHFKSEAFYPVGLTYDEEGNRFLVSSYAEGVIGAVYYQGNDNDSDGAGLEHHAHAAA